MSALALRLPEQLMIESNQLAKQLNMSRTAFIRMAIEDEIKKIKHRLQKEEMLAAFQQLKTTKSYQKLSEELDDEVFEINDKGGKWWK